MKNIQTILGTVFLLFGLQTVIAQPQITVTSQGSHSVLADKIVLEVTINLKAEEVDEVFKKYEEQEQVLIDLIKKFGIKEGDLRFNPVSVYPRPIPNPKNRYENELQNIQIRQEVQLALNDFSKYADLQQELVKNGFFDMRARFKTSQASEARDKALEHAVANARKEAELIARESGLKLKRIKAIEYGSHNVNRSYQQRADLRATAESQKLVTEFGQNITFDTSVTITYTVGDK